jgi:hypothetical protein
MLGMDKGREMADTGEPMDQRSMAAALLVPGALGYRYGKTTGYREAQKDRALQEALTKQNEANAYPENNPYGDVIELRDKLAGVYDHVTSQISGLEVAYADLSEQLYGQVKQAARNGTELGEIIQAWSTVTDDPDFVKAAFDQFVPRLFNDGVFHTLDEMGDSITKTAGAKCVNVQHPLVNCYGDFCQALSKLAGLRAQQEELFDAYNQASGFLTEVLRKEAAGLQLKPKLDKAQEFIRRAAGEHLGVGDTASRAIGFGVAKGVPAAAALGAGMYAGHAAIDTGLASHLPAPEGYNPYYDQMRMMRQQGY